MRVVLGVVAVGQALLAIGFLLHADAVTDLWPFPGTSPLSETFVGSILLAASASTGWCLLLRSDRAFVGVALDYLAILVPLVVVTAVRLVDDGGADLVGFGAMCLVSLVFGAVLLRVAARRPWRSEQRTPALVRWSFAAFVAALVVVGGMLVVRVENVMPWPVTPELSTMFGFMFLGAAVYFAYGVADPHWENAAPQLAGFLAYDVVLVGPFLERLPSIPEQFERSLWIYLAVIGYSALLAAWFLLLDPRTRVGAHPGPARVPVTPPS
jgi:hypothetical protein